MLGNKKDIQSHYSFELYSAMLDNISKNIFLVPHLGTSQYPKRTAGSIVIHQGATLESGFRQ